MAEVRYPFFGFRLSAFGFRVSDFEREIDAPARARAPPRKGAPRRVHRSMNDIADRQFSVRTTCSIDGAKKRSVSASTRSSDGH